MAGPNATAVPSHPNPYNVYGAQYPRIEEDNRVTFHFTAPNAQKVQVALVTSGQGSLSPLPYDMIKGADGVWTYTLSVPQSPGYHNYWMLVDGAIVLDPATKAFMGYNHMCNGFEIPEAAQGTAPSKILATHTTSGTVDRSRPLCPYPQVARWKGSGSTDDASNFECVTLPPIAGSERLA